MSRLQNLAKYAFYYLITYIIASTVYATYVGYREFLLFKDYWEDEKFRNHFAIGLPLIILGILSFYIYFFTFTYWSLKI